MGWTTWWLRIVGGLYLILTLVNLYFLTANLDFFGDSLPYEATPDVVGAFADAWLVFVLELGALGAAMIAASWRPWESRPLIWAILGAELLRGVVADVVWLTRGYSPATYVPFIVLHLVVVATGILALRRDADRYGQRDT